MKWDDRREDRSFYATDSDTVVGEVVKGFGTYTAFVGGWQIGRYSTSDGAKRAVEIAVQKRSQP